MQPLASASASRRESACRRIAGGVRQSSQDASSGAVLNEPAIADSSLRMLSTSAPRATLLVRVAVGAVFLSEGTRDRSGT